MEGVPRWFWLGSRREVERALAAAFGSPPEAEAAGTAGPGDLVLVDAAAAPADCGSVPAGHAFAAVRALKERAGVAVAVVVDAGDRIGEQLARFCLADGVVRWRGPAAGLDLGEFRPGHAAHPKPSVDALLERVQADVAAHGHTGSAVARLLQFEREDSLLTRLQDPATGLFDGPYATLKLDEEWKRAMRFHQPLSLLLLDLGDAEPARAATDRQRLLADAAGVFLNECRDIDVLARFAPGTFLFLLPGTGPEGAAVVARRMLGALRQRFTGQGVRPCCGLASAPSSQIPDRKAFLCVAAANLARAQAGEGDGGLCTSWQ